jgi:NAD(P)-dependent dehydrogenase (short-subunit alcohol dehydrogenase family)
VDGREMSLNITSSDLQNLQGKIVIITGGSNGLGLAAAKLFSSQGSLVTIADLRPPLESISNTTFSYCDVTNWDSILSTFEVTVQKHGRVDCLIANAGVGEVEDLFVDGLEKDGKLKQPKHVVLDINLKGAIDCVKVAIHYMRKQESGGGIVLTTSTAAYKGEKCAPGYSAAKHGVFLPKRTTELRGRRYNKEKIS